MADPQHIRPVPAPWERRARPNLLGVDAGARRVGHLRWVEGRLFEILGGWVPSVPEVDVKLQLAAASRRHGWHVELWGSCLPELPDLAAERVTVPAGDAVARALDLAAAAGSTLERLAGVYRAVVPHVVAACTVHQATASTVSDAATLRVLRIVLDDLTEDWRAGEAAVQSLLRDDADLRRASDHQRAVESLLLAAGGVCGPGTLGPAGSGEPVDISG